MYRPTHFSAGNPEFRSRNKCLAPLISCCLIFLLADFARAGSATWKRHARSGDWNTKTNWTPAHVPNASTDTATFALSNTTNVSISANTEVNGVTFTPAASAYTITVNPNLTLTISGVGITNNSGMTQHVHIPVDASSNGGTIVFSNSATAGSDVSILNDGGTINFLNTSTAGSATIRNFSDDFTTPSPTTNFFNRSTAGNSTIANEGGSVSFANNSTAGNSAIVNEGGAVYFADNSTAGNSSIGVELALAFSVFFADNSTAGSAFIDLARGGTLQFADNSTAANSTIDTFYSANVQFSGNSTAGSASIEVGDGSNLDFDGHSTAGSASISGSSYVFFRGSSRGGTAQIVLGSVGGTFLGTLDISGHNAPGVTIGSLEGVEEEPGSEVRVFLGANNLTVGSNNLSTTFAGTIQDGGSLTKIGTGTLDLTGANTYTGATNVNGGVLKVDGSITSNTFVNHGGTLAGTGTINGDVTNNGGTVSPGDAPGSLTVASYTQASGGTLLIDIAGANSGQFSVLDVLGNANLDGFLHPVLLNGFIPTVGESFTFLAYGSLFGAFSTIKDLNFDDMHWSVTYQPTYAVLTAEAGRAVPDQCSTLLLLMSALLGLVTYRRQLLRTQP
jgi:autotransporter-associated beta strand protein